MQHAVRLDKRITCGAILEPTRSPTSVDVTDDSVD